MSRHGIVEHVPKRRLFGKPDRCRCGNHLPCVVQAAITRQQFLNPEAAPPWNAPTTTLSLWSAAERTPRTTADRPLMTPGQQHRSQGVPGAWS
jgi:hypothetical protein